MFGCTVAVIITVVLQQEGPSWMFSQCMLSFSLGTPTSFHGPNTNKPFTLNLKDCRKKDAEQTTAFLFIHLVGTVTFLFASQTKTKKKQKGHCMFVWNESAQCVSIFSFYLAGHWSELQVFTCKKVLTRSTNRNHYSRKQEFLWLTGAQKVLIAINCTDKCVEQQHSSFTFPLFVLFHLPGCLPHFFILFVYLHQGQLYHNAAFASGQACFV